MIKLRKYGLNSELRFVPKFVRFNLRSFAELYGFHSETVKLTVKQKKLKMYCFHLRFYGFTVTVYGYGYGTVTVNRADRNSGSGLVSHMRQVPQKVIH